MIQLGMNKITHGRVTVISKPSPDLATHNHHYGASVAISPLRIGFKPRHAEETFRPCWIATTNIKAEVVSTIKIESMMDTK